MPPDNRAVVAPIYQSVKFELGSLEETERLLRGERQGFFYTRASNPTIRQLELLVAELQGKQDCLVTSTGVGAIAHGLLALTKQRDHVICFIESYNPTRYLVRRLLGRFGVTHTLLSIEDIAGLEQALAVQPTRLVFLESPTNPTTRIADLTAITRLAHAAGALVVLDNTFAGLHQHGQYDIDLYLHSLTKYASGTGDVMGGAVIGSTELIRGMRSDFSALGGTLDPHAAFLILRGLKTYFVRYKAQCASAQRIATLLAEHPAVTRVCYPGLASHPQHALARAQMEDFGTIVTFDLKGNRKATARFVDALELFALAASLGATESLVVAAPMMKARDLTPEQQRISAISDSTVRLSIGLEDPEDLIQDLKQALAAAH
jgi:cystathionine beta-lyase/cystathionine gamma-synthase